MSDLITQGPSNQTKMYSSPYTALEDAVFGCVFNNSQNISILWLKESTPLSSSSNYVISSYTGNSTLTIVNATRSDIGTYTCNASTTGTSEAQSAYLDVVGELLC